MTGSRRVFSCLVFALLAGVALPTGPFEPALAEARDEAPACNEQKPQAFLVRGNYAFKRDATPEEKQVRKATHQRAIRYRTERYGHVEGFGLPDWNRKSPKDYAAKTTFMGFRVSMNRRVVPALRCVEAEIVASCSEWYQPQYVSGMRGENTFQGGEVSNHRYGIAIDIDPERNVCCGCVGPASDHPICKRPASVSERKVIPDCWIAAFERFGFYWLGRDELEDTMHFEFLGDPDRITKSPSP
jgi:hypothetical protein